MTDPKNSNASEVPAAVQTGNSADAILRRLATRAMGLTGADIERIVRENKVDGRELKLRMTLTAENAPLRHVVETTIDLS